MYNPQMGDVVAGSGDLFDHAKICSWEPNRWGVLCSTSGQADWSPWTGRGSPWLLHAGRGLSYWEAAERSPRSPALAKQPPDVAALVACTQRCCSPDSGSQQVIRSGCEQNKQKHVLIVLKIEFIFFSASFRERSFQLQSLPAFFLP
jgi:hypothetical protein